ncbi:LLM class flavin-dependent oxidoreductase [Miltoncostaea marina]|uniref:LLM class flavin-dependent oxidoreductase n=1 Tax=Miltoncostaea marina TaxID=2843215 RepID=UPI001C3D6E5B|nr:LLM class flavin-dependent oxidoreductase [Miltoncostaea marina]
MSVSFPLSVLDLAPVADGQPVRESLEGTVRLARRAEELGYLRVWYAEHHNFPSIASSATAVLIAHVAAHTERIRLGAGGIMLPNHSPLVIAEQFGTLATLHPGRIDLGLGRAPGTDGGTMLALRRDHRAADTFPEDVAELQGYLSGETLIPGVHAYPGRGTEVPLYILGSSLFGAQLAAVMGLPYAFASHFAPAALRDAVALYRERFQPSAQLERPYVIAAINVLAADTETEALRQLEVRRREIARTILSPPGHRLSDDEIDRALASPQGRHVEQMFTYTALGEAEAVAARLAEFRAHADADELITVHGADTVEGRLRSLELVAETAGVAAA